MACVGIGAKRRGIFDVRVFVLNIFESGCLEGGEPIRTVADQLEVVVVETEKAKADW